MANRELERLGAVAGRKHVVARALQAEPHEHANVLVVVGDEDEWAVPWAGIRLCLPHTRNIGRFR